MKISLNWIKQFTDIEVSVEELIAKIGSQLGEVEEVVYLNDQYKDVTIAKVVRCEQHPNADKLKICTLDVGSYTDYRGQTPMEVEVVCGAPNVAKDMLIAWLPPGSIVPETYFSDEQFKLEARELRGVVSNGMIASARELGLGDEHEGILEIDEEAKPGDSFAEVYDLKDEVVIDIENKMFTHRPDCFGVLGVAREIAGIQGINFKSPQWYLELEDGIQKKEDGNELPLKIDVQIPELVPRFMAVAIADIDVKHSPIKVRSYLSRVGLKPINNIVDTTNIVMHLTGQPLHAFDYDKVAKASGGEPVIEVRHPKKDEKIKLFNGKTITPREEAIMIATPKQLIGVGGVMGGSETEVDSKTKNIILECATFDMYSIRKTSMEHGLFTDAVTRFNKGQSPWQNDKVLAIAILDVLDFAGGTVASETIDVKQELPANPEIEVSIDFINSRLGSNLSAQEMSELLENVEFNVERQDNNLQITVPVWRTDIAIAEDIVEEVGRLHGYDSLPKVLPTRSTKPTKRSKVFSFKQRLRKSLAQSGANELLTYSFVPASLIETAEQNLEDAYTISNALSPDLQHYRLSLTPSLLQHVHANIKAGHKEFTLFEIGKSHNKQYLNDEGLPLEIEALAAVYTRNYSGESGAAYYNTIELLNRLAWQLKLTFKFTPLKDDKNKNMLTPFDLERSAEISIAGQDGWIGVVGEYKNSVARRLKLPAHSAGFEISVFDLMKHADSQPRYVPLNKYPSTELDVTLQVANSVSFGELATDLIEAAHKQMQDGSVRIDILPLQSFRPKGAGTINHSFRLFLTPLSQTLNSDQANIIKKNILGTCIVTFKEI